MTPFNLQSTEYIAARGSQFTDEDAQVIGPELERLAECGTSTTVHIVAAAKRKDSPLHGYFEWNNRVAGDLHRQQQAGHMARSVKIVVQNTETKEVREVRAFLPVHLTVVAGESAEPTAVDTEGRPAKSYVPIRLIKEDAMQSKQVIRDAWRHLAAWKDRYSIYRTLFTEFDEALGEMFDAVDRAKEKLDERGEAA